MSDFDEEAERERLREQYEREQQKREATEHMSDLLLKGATMTDSHCDTCGDPIFRYDGQEFCPTCQERVGDGANVAGEDEAETGSGEAAAESGAGESSPEPSETGEATQSAASTPGAEADSAAPEPQDTTTSESATRSGERVEVPTVDPGQDRAPPAGRSGNLADARESLTATLVTFARQAETTDDPRRARDALEAAREAAEALDALESVR